MEKYGITPKEIDAIRFYQGDIRKRDVNGNIINEKQSGFWGTPSAYKTLNCLMFPGIENEMERIKEKQASLVPQLPLEADEVCEIFCDIFRAMIKYKSSVGKQPKLGKVYRTERGISIEELKKGYTVSFTSTSKSVKPDTFLTKKSDLTLLEILFPTDTWQLDLEEILGADNLYPQQKEILFPPFMRLEIREIELDEQEKEIYKEKLPQKKYIVEIKNELVIKPDFIKTEEWLTAVGNERAAELLDKLIKNETLSKEEIDDYCNWKKAFQSKVKSKFKAVEMG